MNTIATTAGITLTALAVARICMKKFEAAVLAGDGRQQRKWRRRLQLAATGDRRTVDAVIRWL